jgi:hypothetical protein
MASQPAKLPSIVFFVSECQKLPPNSLPIRHAVVSPMARKTNPVKLKIAKSELKNPPSRIINDTVGAKAIPMSS